MAVNRAWTAGLLAAALGLPATLSAACTRPPPPRLTVDEASALFDAPLHIHVTGARPGQSVRLDASATDSAGRHWHSTATFVAAPDGSVDVTSARPVAGSYYVASATGLLWSMAPESGLYYSFTPAGTAYTVRLSLVVGGKAVASSRFERLTEAPGVHSRLVDQARDGIYGMMYEPADTTRPGPAVLVFGGSEGGLSTGNDAAAYASHGYPTLALAYFGEPGLPPTLANVPLEYFVTALRWLARQPGVDPARIVVEGISRGSEPALLLGASYPDLVHAVVALVPSSTVFSGLPDITQPAWTRDGTAVPFVQAGRGYGRRSPAAAIPVERIRGPIFLLCGQSDALWPSCAFVDEITRRLAAHPSGYPVVALAEPEAGHFVGSPLPNLASSSTVTTSPAYGTLVIGGTQAADALGRLDAWPRLLAFLAAQ